MRTSRAAAFPLVATTVTMLCGCGGTAAAVLRYRPSPIQDDAEAQRVRIEEAVRDVASVGRLSCRRPDDTGHDLLECWPDRLGSSPAFVSLHVRKSPEAYEISILESFGGFSGPRHLCAIQHRLAERLESRTAGGVVELDSRRACPHNSSASSPWPDAPRPSEPQPPRGRGARSGGAD
jgi:hypothetical protein